MGPATETTAMTDVLLKATDETRLENSSQMFLEVEKYQCAEMKAVWRNTVGLLPLLVQRGMFGRAQKGRMCSPQSRASCSLGWGGQLGYERHCLESWELSLERWQPKYFPHQGTVRYLFSSFLSPTHSFQLRPQVHDEKCHCEMEKIGFHPVPHQINDGKRCEQLPKAYPWVTRGLSAGGTCLAFLHRDAQQPQRSQPGRSCSML